MYEPRPGPSQSRMTLKVIPLRYFDAVQHGQRQLPDFFVNPPRAVSPGHQAIDIAATR